MHKNSRDASSPRTLQSMQPGHTSTGGDKGKGRKIESFGHGHPADQQQPRCSTHSLTARPLLTIPSLHTPCPTPLLGERWCCSPGLRPGSWQQLFRAQELPREILLFFLSPFARKILLSCLVGKAASLPPKKITGQSSPRFTASL